MRLPKPQIPEISPSLLVPSAEILLTGSLPSGHELAKLLAEKKDRIKSRSSFFIL